MVLALHFFSGLFFVFSSISQFEACNDALVGRINSTDQLPDVAILYLADEKFWTVLSNHDAEGSKEQLHFGKLSLKGVVEVITSNGKRKLKTYYKYQTKNSIKKADGSTIYSFICSPKMIGLVECKHSGSSPLLFILAKMINPLSDVKGEIEGCKERMINIHNSTIHELAHP